MTSKDDDLYFGLRVSRKSRYRLDSLSIPNQLQGGVNNFVRHQFSTRVILIGCWPLIGNRDQVYSQISPSKQRMGKLTRTAHSGQPTLTYCRVAFVSTPRVKWTQSKTRLSISNRRVIPRLPFWLPCPLLPARCVSVPPMPNHCWPQLITGINSSQFF